MNINNEKMKKVFSDYADIYGKLCESSRNDYIKKLAPGSSLPKAGILYGDDAAATFSAKCTELRQQGNAIIDDEMNAINDKLTAAPTAEAVNACTLLSLRKSKDAEEYRALLKKYGDNVQTGDTIRAIAKQNNVLSLPDDPIKEKAEALESLRGTIYRDITPRNAAQGNTSPGHIAVFNMIIDEAIPE